MNNENMNWPQLKVHFYFENWKTFLKITKLKERRHNTTRECTREDCVEYQQSDEIIRRLCANQSFDLSY